MTMSKKTRTEKGNCYELACKLFLRLANEGIEANLVHGFVRNPSGNTINHAWVELPSRNLVLDPSDIDPKTGKGTRYDLDDFYKRRRGKKQAMYTNPLEVASLVNSTKSWGPNKWIAKTR